MLDYNQNYSLISGSLWNYYRNKIDNIHDNASDGKSFKYIQEKKKKIERKTTEKPVWSGDTNKTPQPAVPTLNVELTISLRYLSNFWRFLDLPLINYEIELDLT